MTSGRIVTVLRVAAVVATLSSSTVRAADAANPAVPDNIMRTMALVVCDDGSQKTYRTAFVVGSNGFESFLIGEGGTGCHAPTVILSAEPARRYPAQPLFAPPMSLVPVNNLVLAIEHPVTAVAPLEQVPFQKNEPVLLAGYPITADTDGAPSSVAAGTGTVTFVSTPTPGQLGSDGGFISSTTTMAAAIVVDADAKSVAGFVDAQNALLEFGKPPATRYFLRTSAALIGLLQTRELTPGVQTLSGDALTAARLGAALMGQTFPIFRGGRVSGHAVVLGTTATATVFAALQVSGSGDLAIAARERAGTVRMVNATVVATDQDTSMSFLQTPRLDVAVPQFSAPPAANGAVAVPATHGNCEYTPTAPFPDGCRLRIVLGHMTGPVAFPRGVVGLTGLTDTINDSSRGLPVLDLASGAIVGIATQGGIIPMPAILAKAATLPNR